MKYIISIFAIASALGLAACGSDDPSCESAADKICAAACACTNANNECIVGDDTFRATFDDNAECLVFFKGLGCMASADEAQFDWAACESAIDAATCTSVMVDATTTVEAFPQPAACQTAE